MNAEDVSKMQLFGAMALGLETTVYDRQLETYLKGFVYEIGLESGYAKSGKPPTKFLVRLYVTSSPIPKLIGQVVEVYVPTVD